MTVLKTGKWSRKGFVQCKACGRCDRPHKGRGYCASCYAACNSAGLFVMMADYQGKRVCGR